jgi:TRAP transporter TAXI family solute receptor
MIILKKALLAAAMVTVSALPLAAQEAPSSLTVSTASPGGVYAIYGEGLAQLISKEVGIPTSTRQTQGPAQNLVLLQSGQTDLALTTTGPAYEAMNGMLDLAPGNAYTDMRALFSMYPTPFQMVALSASGISALDDLDGKRVGAGPRGGTGGIYWERWLKDLEIGAELQYGGIGDQGGQMGDGRLDAIILAGGIPHPSISELDTTKDVTIFGMSEETVAGILETNPYVVDFTIPKGTYSSQPEDLLTVAMWNIVVADASMSDEVAYDITKAVIEGNAAMVSTHSAAKDTIAENILRNTFIPLHPGAARYYEEIGFDIPAAIAPR